MDVMEAIRNRRSVRAYSSEPIPDDVMRRMQQALRWAPSARNNQPWHFVFVTDEALKQRLAKTTNGYDWIAEAPVIVVACGDPAAASNRIAGYRSSVEIDVTIALDHLALAATAEGLGTCWVGGFRESEVRPLLDIPEPLLVIELMPLGYPASPEMNRPINEADRKSADETFSVNRYGRR